MKKIKEQGLDVIDKLKTLINIDKFARKLHLDKTKKQTLYIFSGLFIIISLLYFVLLVLPPFIKVITSFAKINSIKTEIKSIDEDLKNLDSLKKRKLSLKEEALSYEQKLPSEYEIPLLLEELSAMAKNSFVKIRGISPITIMKKPKEGQESKMYERIPIQMSSESGYHQLSKFINSMENGDRFMNITDINIVSNDRNPGIETMELTVNTYVLLEK